MQRMDKEIQYPLYWCLSDEAKQILIEWQWEHHDLKLQKPPPLPSPYVPHIEDTEELEHLMKMKPKGKVRG